MSKKVYLSPSDQTKNQYAYGNTTEAIQCGKIAAACKTALERCGIEVMVGQYDTMANRCAASDKFGANLHVPIHTNAYNGQVTGTRMFCYNSNGEGMKACKAIFNVLAPLTPGTSESITVNTNLYEVKYPAAPTAYIECEFHDNASAAKWIVEHTTEIGEAIAQGICNYFGIAYKKEEVKKEETSSTPADSNELYRVRKTWADVKSQIGAYRILENAKKACPKGYKVYNSKGSIVYSNDKKSVDEVAREVIKGLWGNGAERRKKLEAAGYNYDEVQARVNALLGN